MTRRSIAIVFGALYGLSYLTMSEATLPTSFSPSYINYTTVTGFFKQDDPATDSSTFDYTKENFGLIERSYDTDKFIESHGSKTSWERFTYYVNDLNRRAPQNVDYKLLFMGRHGEGYHNTAEAFYGTPLWNCYWSEQNGNATTTWADAHLTENGVKQAQVANSFWAKELAEQKVPAPQRYYTSPLARCLATAQITFSGLRLPVTQPFFPEVKELLREAIGIHTCDRRSSRTWIRENYPTYPIEFGFTENDELWSPTLRETNSAQDARLKKLLDDVFSHDRNTFLSFTSHSGTIGSILRVIGHRNFGLNTGAIIPVLVRAEYTNKQPPSSSIAPSTTAPTCTVNPTATATSGS